MSELANDSQHAESLKTYILVLLALLVLTAITVGAATVDFGSAWNEVVALGIATLKAYLVVMFFMHVHRSTRLVKLFAVAGFFWLALFIALILPDYLGRGWIS